MISKSWLWWILAPSVALAQGALRPGAIPADPLELAAGPVAAAQPAAHTAALQLLGRARGNYALRSAGRAFSGQAYDIKVAFTVNSGGQTAHDGAWQMEDMFDPRLGFRWTATGPDGYSITRIRAQDGMLYGDETGSYVPLRLQEARAALFDPIPHQDSLGRASVRTSTAEFNGAQLTCVLLSGQAKDAKASGGRRWNEAEECIDPQTGLLATHSPVPGRYFAYDYKDARRFDGRVLPDQVTVTEGGKTVTTISVQSLTALDNADPSLFAPTAEMKANGRPIALGGARKMDGPPGQGAAGGPVCVFGVVTSAGELMEAHSLQPSSPNSGAAVAAAQQMTFSRPPLGVPAQQYFVYIMERFRPPQ